MRFKPGQSGNPRGRAVGTRQKLGEAFLTDMLEGWQKDGKRAIARVIRDRPHAFLQTMAALMPKELKIDTGPFEGLSDDDLTTILDVIRSALAAESGGTDPATPTQH
jgi:hypothetical protein